jgi:hypothetical protein
VLAPEKVWMFLYFNLPQIEKPNIDQHGPKFVGDTLKTVTGIPNIVDFNLLKPSGNFTHHQV